MDSVIGIKLKFHPTPEQEIELAKVHKRYRDACNFVSLYAFENNEYNYYTLQKALYNNLRTQFNLKSQLTLSVIKTVVTQYKTIKEQLKQNPYVYKDEKGKWKYIAKTLEWMCRPVFFKRPQADLVRDRDYSFVEKGTLVSINTLNERIRVPFETKGFDKYIEEGYKLGTAKLVQNNGLWFLHIGATKEVEDFDYDNIKHVVGIDRGLRQLMVTSDEETHSEFYSGKAVRRKRKHYEDLRASLQKHNTKSSKRRIRRLNNKENRWMTDLNHQLSKTLCSKYGKGTVFVLENLSGVQFAADDTSKQSKKENHTWAFYQLERFLAYKAIMQGSTVLKVDPAYTSQRCPKCGHIDKEQRDHKLHEYRCQCGYISNDDRLAAMNIQILGQYILDHPEFEKQPSYKDKQTLKDLA